MASSRVPYIRATACCNKLCHDAAQFRVSQFFLKRAIHASLPAGQLCPSAGKASVDTALYLDQKRRKTVCGVGDRIWVSTSSISYEEPILNEGPSCVFVGPVESAGKDRLEALYQQARDSYYSGHPLIVDDMFDKVEVRLRWYGSKLVLKYPRCSLKRLSAYADAEVDHSQVWTLASVWMMLLAVGLVTVLAPPVCVVNNVCKDAVLSRVSIHHFFPFTSETLMTLNGFGATAIGLAVGIPVTMASLGALEGLWRGDLVALKGSCPSCGEEVYAFVRVDNTHSRHKTECHVCEHPLVFHAKVEHSAAPYGRPWVYGRVYLVTRSKDLAPR